jgi:hypothetical protein
LESDTGFTKFGDGSSTYANLSYNFAPTNNNVVFKTSSAWALDTTTILAPGQFGIETDSGRIKCGDGIRDFDHLNYMSAAATLDVIRKTDAQWANDGSRIMVLGQVGINTTYNWMKVGDGVTTWDNLDYLMTPTTTVELSSSDGEGGTTTTVTDTIVLTMS